MVNDYTGPAVWKAAELADLNQWISQPKKTILMPSSTLGGLRGLLVANYLRDETPVIYWASCANSGSALTAQLGMASCSSNA